jgi:hypothetical protein
MPVTDCTHKGAARERVGDGGDDVSVDVSGSGVREAKLACKCTCWGEAWGLTGRHGGGEDGQEGGGWRWRRGGGGVRGSGGRGGDGERTVDKRSIEGSVRVAEGDVTGVRHSRIIDLQLCNNFY